MSMSRDELERKLVQTRRLKASVTNATANLIAQLRELDRLRDRVRKAQLSAGDRGGYAAEMECSVRTNKRGRLGWLPVFPNRNLTGRRRPSCRRPCR